MFQRMLTAAALFLCATLSSATEFYVSPGASASGNGSIGNPWKLQTALNQPGAVHAGDTIWMRGGTYPGSYTSQLTGSAGNPVVLRQFPGERATIDGGNSNGMPILFVKGANAWYWGFEVMSSNTDRVTSVSGPGPGGTEIPRGEGVVIDQSTLHDGLKFINMIVHDARQGFSFWDEATNSEIYGALVYYNGWSAPDDGHGHGVYGQNKAGNSKKVTDSIIFANFGEGAQFYGSSAATIDNIELTGNTLFLNGVGNDFTRNVLVGGEGPTLNPKLVANALYYEGGPTTALKLGQYGSNCESPTMTDNYVANNVSVYCNSMSISGNTFFGSIQGFTQSQFPANTYHSARPGGVKVFIRPNQYEAGRAHITVFNWDAQPSISIDLGSYLSVGQAYEIRNAQNYFGAPVVAGTYDGASVSLPMSMAPAPPVGWPSPASTGPDFNAFVLIAATGPNEFLDVFPSNPHHADIVTLAANGITAGCGGGEFCPDQQVLRDQMAVFLLRSAHGSTYTPAPATGAVFDDVPSSAFAAAWIEALASEGVTTGCGGGDYCPRNAVNRAQMAIFLLKGSLGPSYLPPAATGGVFSDVPAGGFAAAWIEDLAGRGITAGCGAGRYCPTAAVKRGPMATLLVRAFDLP